MDFLELKRRLNEVKNLLEGLHCSLNWQKKESAEIKLGQENSYDLKKERYNEEQWTASPRNVGALSVSTFM